MLEELEHLLAAVKVLLPAVVKQDAAIPRREKRETFAVNLKTLNAEDLK
jgi:hypothetical protein